MTEYLTRIRKNTYDVNEDLSISAAARLVAEGNYLHVIGVYAVTFTEEIGFGKSAKTVTRNFNEPVFALDGMTVNAPSAFGPKTVEVNWPGIGASSPELTRTFANLLLVAAQIAAEANLILS
jgi:hypothetical protein